MTQDLMSMYLKWYELSVHAVNAYRVEGEISRELIEGLVLSGMGGSGIVGDVIYSLLYDKVDIPIITIKDYSLPKWVKKGWFVIAISYSGNTLETIHVMTKSLRRGAKLAVITSDGKLLEYAKIYKIPFIKVDEGYVPRAAFPLLLIATLKILEELNLYNASKFYESLGVLNDNKTMNVADEISNFVGNSIPIFITNSKYYPLGLRCKDEFNENAKLISKVEVIPEWGHNDIVGWESRYGNVKAIVLNDGSEILNYVWRYLRDYGHEVKNVEISISDDYLTNIIYWSKVFGISSIKLALSKGINPKETKSISKYKEFLKHSKLARINFREKM